MDRNVLRLRDQPGLGVEQGAGRVHALLDVWRVCRELEYRPHFLRHRFQGIAQDL